MQEEMKKVYANSAINVYICDSDKNIIWANKEKLSDKIGKSASCLFEEKTFPDKTGIVSGIMNGEPYRYNIISYDGFYIIETLNENMMSENFEVKSIRESFEDEAANIREYIQNINFALENLEDYFKTEELFDEMHSLTKILNGCYDVLRLQRQREEMTAYTAKRGVAPKIFSIRDFFVGNEKNLEEFALRKASIIEFDYGADELFVNVNPERFSSMFFLSVFNILKTMNDAPSIYVKGAVVGDEVSVRISRAENEAESRQVFDCTSRRRGNPVDKSLDFTVLKMFCKEYNCRNLIELCDEKAASVTIFLPKAKPDGSALRSGVKSIARDKRFSDMRIFLYEATNLRFIYGDASGRNDEE